MDAYASIRLCLDMVAHVDSSDYICRCVVGQMELSLEIQWLWQATYIQLVLSGPWSHATITSQLITCSATHQATLKLWLGAGWWWQCIPTTLISTKVAKPSPVLVYGYNVKLVWLKAKLRYYCCCNQWRQSNALQAGESITWSWLSSWLTDNLGGSGKAKIQIYWNDVICHIRKYWQRM